MFSSKKDIVGIDIGSSSVKAVLLKASRGGYQLESLGVLPLAPEMIVDNAIMNGPAIANTISSLLGSLGLKNKRVATAVSGHAVIIRKITLPQMSEAELESTIHWEAEQYIPYDLSEVNLDFYILGPDQNDASLMHVILVAAKKEFVEDYQALFVDAGLKLEVMDIDCFALENLFCHNYGFSEGEVVALIDLGASETSINIIKNGTSVFTREIQTGGQLLNEDLQKRLGLSSDEAEKAKLGSSDGIAADGYQIADILAASIDNLTLEIQRSLDFFSATSAKDSISRAYLTGGVSNSDDVCKSLADKLEIPVARIDPFRSIKVDEKRFDSEYLERVGPLFAVATGLAMRKVGGQ